MATVQPQPTLSEKAASDRYRLAIYDPLEDDPPIYMGPVLTSSTRDMLFAREVIREYQRLCDADPAFHSVGLFPVEVGNGKAHSRKDSFET